MKRPPTVSCSNGKPMSSKEIGLNPEKQARLSSIIEGVDGSSPTNISPQNNAIKKNKPEEATMTRKGRESIKLEVETTNNAE